MLTTPDLNKGGTITIIRKSMASGTENSNESHFIPPPAFIATNAGADTKLIAESWVAIADKLNGNHPMLLPPRK
jgi:hypothetical protein